MSDAHASDAKSVVRAVVLTLAAAGLAPVQAATPDSLAARIKQCAALSGASTRLACYDALARSQAADEAAPRAATVAPANAGPSTAASGAAASGATGSGSPGSGAPAAAAAASPAPATSAAAAPSAPPAPNPADFGIHNGPLEVKRGPVRQQQMIAVVSGVSNRPRGELIVSLDNGQVWLQNEPTFYPLKPGDHVEIDVGALGSYVMWCPSSRRATKVTRID